MACDSLAEFVAAYPLDGICIDREWEPLVIAQLRYYWGNY